MQKPLGLRTAALQMTLSLLLPVPHPSLPPSQPPNPLPRSNAADCVWITPSSRSFNLPCLDLQVTSVSGGGAAEVLPRCFLLLHSSSFPPLNNLSTDKRLTFSPYPLSFSTPPSSLPASICPCSSLWGHRKKKSSLSSFSFSVFLHPFFSLSISGTTCSLSASKVVIQ